jgi:hypothetical protein
MDTLVHQVVVVEDETLVLSVASHPSSFEEASHQVDHHHHPLPTEAAFHLASSMDPYPYLASY